MPRATRVELPGAIYHVMDRGDRREDLFIKDVDRRDFLKTLAEACQKTAWQAQEELKPLRRGWCLGSEQFRQEMLERMDGNDAIYIRLTVPAGRGRLEPRARIVPEDEAMPSLKKMKPW